MSTQIKIRRDTAANWTTANPILGQGEPALETDTLKEKIGDGTTAWTSLPYKAISSAGETVKVSLDDTTAGYLNGKLIAGEGVSLTEFYDASDESLEIKGTTLGISNIDVNDATAVNADSALTTPTYDGSGEAIHPSVVYVKEGWNGYKYWMAMTPYPLYDEDKEDPSILVSNDRTTWVVPPTLTNPIVTTSTAPTYHADANLILGYDNKLYCYYRKVPGGTVTNSDIMETNSSDGVTWSTPTTVITTTSFNLVSPCVIKENGTYYMYLVDATTMSTRTLEKISSTSPDSGWSFASPTTCTINNEPSGKKIWHFEIRKYHEEYHMFIAVSNTADTLGNELYFATSQDGEEFDVGDNPLIEPGVSGNWDDYMPYKGSGVLLNDYTYAFWYSGFDGAPSTGSSGTGYTEIVLNKFNSASRIATATAIDLSNNDGTYYNMNSANSATTYTTTNPKLGGFAVIRINAASEPSVTGATKLAGDTFAVSTDMHLVIQYFGVTVQFYFIGL